MHADRKTMVFYFGMTCLLVFVFSYGAAFAFRPEARLVALILLPIWIVLALGLGYRAFYFSDDWYRAREEREQAWLARHPHVSVVFRVVIALGLVAFLVRFIWL